MSAFHPFVLGGNVFGWTVKPEDAPAILDRFVEQGGHAIDTADIYPAWASHGGHSEEIIGAWMAERKNRAQLNIATKVAKWDQQRGLSAKNLQSAVEGSLRRLGTDYIDIYYAHEDDTSVPQAEYVHAFDALVKQGKVRQLGASNFTPDRLSSAIQLARTEGLTGFTVAQDKWNLVERGLETSLLPVLQKEHVTEFPYYALAAGFLTGKYRPGVRIDSPRAGTGDYYLKDPKNHALLDKLDALAAAHRVSVSAIALAWLRAQPTVGAPIASARTCEQLDALFQQVTLSKDELASL